MTSTRDGRDGDYGSRAADSAGCLLVVSGYSHNAGMLDRVVEDVKDRIELSPSMVDFFEVRFVDMGARPGVPADVAVGVARLALEFTSRPGDVARNFSALVVVDQSAAVIDRVLRACRDESALSKLRVRYLGLAGKDDRQPPAAPSGDGVEIAVARNGGRTQSDLIADIYRHAGFLLQDFGSGAAEGLAGHTLNEIASKEEPELRRIVVAAQEAEHEAARKAREAEAAKQAEIRKQVELQRREAQERQQAEERQAEERRRQADLQREQKRREAEAKQAEIRRQEAEIRQREAKIRQEGERISEDAGQRQAEPAQRAEEQELSAEQPRAGDNRPSIEARPSGETLGQTDERGKAPGGNGGRPPSETSEVPPGRPSEHKQTSVPARRPGPGPGLLDSGVIKGILRVFGSKEAAGLPAGDVEALLHECVGRLQAGDSKEAKACIQALHAGADQGISPEDRQYYRAVVVEGRLLQPGLPLGKLAVPFYQVVLRLAFGQPLDYAAYCDVENCLTMFGESGRLPYRQAVVQAIELIGANDVRVLALMGYQLGPVRPDKWSRSHGLDLTQLVTALAAGKWGDPAHADNAYIFTHRYLNCLGSRDDRWEVRSALQANGYLAAALYDRYPGLVARQANELASFLRSAYPHGLDSKAIAEVYQASVPTEALARATLRTLAAPGYGPVVIRMYMWKIGENPTPAQQANLLKHLSADPRA